MSILGAESYAAVRHLVTDVEALSTEERSRVLWYACDGGDLSMVKSVIRAGCDVDHFHRGHTPLMMASIGGHDDVVKELILAGCKVDLWSSKCSVGWFGFVTGMASAWSALVVWVVTTLFMSATKNMLVSVVCYWLLVLTIALHFFSEESYKLSLMLRVKARTKYMAWAAGIVPASVLVWRVVVTAVSEVELFLPPSMLVVVETVTMLLVVAGAGALAVVKEMARTGSGTWTAVVAAALVTTAVGARLWEGVGTEAVLMTGAVTALLALTATDTVTAVAAVAVAVVRMWIGGGPGAEEETIAYAFVGPGFVGKVVGAALMLVLALSVAMVGAGVVRFTVAILVTGIVMTAGIAGLALWNTVLKSIDLPVNPMLPVMVLLTLTPVKVIRRMITLSTTGMTALHYAAWYNHITCGAHLVEAGANVQAENRYFRTPLHICSRRFRAVVQQAQSHPPKHVIVVIGNTDYGKSTLIAALQSESRTLCQKLVYRLSQVHNISQRTAGIETVPFFSAKYGRVSFYDFAGQCNYHGPHQPFLEAILGKPGVTVTVLLLVKVSEGRDVITQQLRRWLQPLALARTPSTPRVIVVGSFLDQAKSKNSAANVQRLQGCIDSVQNEYPSLKVQELFLLDCREPESAGIKGLRSCLQWTQSHKSTQSTSGVLYNVPWVMAQLRKAFSGQSLQLNAFSGWLQDNAQNLPTHLPSPEDVCQDLSAAGCILFLHNKQDLYQSWLVLDLQTILHNVYGTLFSPSRAVVNQFGLLHCSVLSTLFPKLNPEMIQEVLITLEFCIRVDPLLLKEEMLSLTEQDEVEGWLYFPALVSAEAHEVFKQDQQCLHWVCWQLKTDDGHIILAHLLQGILLHLAATHVFIEKELPPSVRKHCCSVWANGLSWGSTTGVDVAVQISDSSVVQVIGRSREGPGELYRYLCSVTQSIFKTIARLSPALKATPYIIHPYTYIGLDESGQSPPTTRYPVASIVSSIEAGHKYVHSLPISSCSGSNRVSLQELFGGWWSPSLTVVQCLKEAQEVLSELSGMLHAVIYHGSHWPRIVFTK